METFDKHGWLKTVQADNRFTEHQFRLAFVICNQFTRRDGTGWAVKLADVAAAIGGTKPGLSLDRLKSGLAKLCEARYLVETQRSKGGAGLKATRCHNLVKPTTPASGVIGETYDASEANLRRQRRKPTTPASNELPSEQPKEGPKGTSKGTSEGTDRLQIAWEASVCKACGDEIKIGDGYQDVPAIGPVCFGCPRYDAVSGRWMTTNARN